MTSPLLYWTDNRRIQAFRSGDTVTVDGSLIVTGSITSGGSTLNPSMFKWVDSKDDFPASVGGIITLENNFIYHLTTTIDLLGDRILCTGVNAIIGGAASLSALTSTGLVGSALITTQYSLTLQNITITADIALDFDASLTGVQTLVWFNSYFVGCATIGTVKSAANFFMTNGATIGSGTLTFDGLQNTIGFTGCYLECSPGTTGIVLAPTLFVGNRFGIVYSDIVTPPTSTAIQVGSTGSIINNETFILDTLHFTGGGTYLSGITTSDNKALIRSCIGIENSNSVATYYMQGNTTSTNMPSAGVFTKIQGTTTPGALISKFTHTSNRVTYTGNLSKNFKVTLGTSVQGTGGDILALRIAKNGTTLADTEAQITLGLLNGGTAAKTRLDGFFTQGIVSITPGDYIEAYMANLRDGTDATIINLNLIIHEI